MKTILHYIASNLLKIIHYIYTFMSKILLRIIRLTSETILRVKQVQRVHSNTFKIILDVIYIPGDLKVLLEYTFILLNQLELYSKISHKTILITVGDSKGRHLSLHKSMFIGPDFNLDIYYEMIRNSIDKLSGYGLVIQEIKTIEILVIDQDRVWTNTNLTVGKRFYSTFITPIKSNANIIPAPITSMNIKTVTSDSEVPCLITLTHEGENGTISKPFIIRNNIKLEVAISQLWKNVFNYIISTRSIKTIFVHNLSESGLHVYKYLILTFSKTAVSCIIDPDNNFITIKFKHKSRTITWLDSNRIFPVNVIDFCKVFEIKCPLVKPIL